MAITRDVRSLRKSCALHEDHLRHLPLHFPRQKFITYSYHEIIPCNGCTDSGERCCRAPLSCAVGRSAVSKSSIPYSCCTWISGLSNWSCSIYGCQPLPRWRQCKFRAPIRCRDFAIACWNRPRYSSNSGGVNTSSSLRCNRRCS
jgi:hypothetical protein